MEGTNAQEVKIISVTVDPDTMEDYADEVPGEDDFNKCGLLNDMAFVEHVNSTDQRLDLTGAHVKGWALTNYASSCQGHTDQFKSIHVRHELISSKRHKSPSKAHKAGSPRSVAKRKHIPPPMSAFEMLLPPLPSGYQRKIVKAPPGALGIRVQLLSQTKYLRLYEVTQRSQIRSMVRAGDIIEGVDDLYQKPWTIEEFVNYCKDNTDKTRYLHMLLKKDTGRTIGKREQMMFTTGMNPLRKFGKAGASITQKDHQGLFVQPTGQERKGMEWDAVNGLWVSCEPKTA